MKIIMIIGDGMADRPIKELGGLTPLEFVQTAHMDRLASLGVSGLLYAAESGVACGSDVAILAILGYDPNKFYSGRGGFEAYGVGVEMAFGDVAFRCDFATVNENFYVVDARAGRVEEGLDELANTLAGLKLDGYGDLDLFYKRALGHKGVLVLRGRGLSHNVAADPPKVGCKAGSVRPLDSSREALKTSQVLNELIWSSYKLLRNHPANRRRERKGFPPANIVIPWGVGTKPELEPFHSKYGLSGACVAAATLIKGICKLAGMTVVDVQGATGDLDTNVNAKAEVALNSLRSHDFVLVHVEAPDEASHDGNVWGKIAIIQKIDEMVGAILDNVDLNDVCVALLSDHVTSTELRLHTADPTPITIAGCGVVKDGVSRYNEKSARRGRLGYIYGRDVMPILLSIARRTESLKHSYVKEF
jgi:2,3-bisphosphoglycerate-independent phosphoglycerate mutase